VKEIIATDKGPKAIGPYSQAVKAGGFIFVSGQVALDAATGKRIDGSIGEQTDRILQNIGAILKAGGSALERTVKTTVFLKSMEDFDAMNEAYARHFPSDPPARSTVEASRLPRDFHIEIDVIALA
jgi:2-iminobutanoate/2-iminopropanoate deaminase